ncbi:hypothetical protein IPR11_22515 [Xanthomonas perforans]|nr:hypothetical protein [Xanthomonas perforans]
MRNLTEEEIMLVSGGASEVNPALSEVPASDLPPSSVPVITDKARG